MWWSLLLVATGAVAAVESASRVYVPAIPETPSADAYNYDYDYGPATGDDDYWDALFAKPARAIAATAAAPGGTTGEKSAGTGHEGDGDGEAGPNDTTLGLGEAPGAEEETQESAASGESLPECVPHQACASVTDVRLASPGPAGYRVRPYCRCPGPPGGGAGACTGADPARVRTFGNGFVQQRFCSDITRLNRCAPGQIVETHIESESLSTYECRCDASMTRMGHKDKYDVYICNLEGRAVIGEWPTDVKHIYPANVEHVESLSVCGESQSCSVTHDLSAGVSRPEHRLDYTRTATSWSPFTVKHLCRCAGMHGCRHTPGTPHSLAMHYRGDVGRFQANFCASNAEPAGPHTCKHGELSILEDIHQYTWHFCTCKKPMVASTQTLEPGRRLQVFCYQLGHHKLVSLHTSAGRSATYHKNNVPPRR